MKTSLINKKVALLVASALAATGLAFVPTTASAAPICSTANYIETCGGVTSDGAKYAMMVPANFNGTMFIYSHGYRYNQDVPFAGYAVSMVTNNPVPAPMPGGVTDKGVIQYLLSNGYGITGSAYATQGWNAEAAVATDVELIKAFKDKYPNTKKVIAWGESLGGFITQALTEQHPELVTAAGIICPALGDVRAELGNAGDALWGLKTFFDPTIKGHGYSAGAAGDAEALVDLGKIIAVGNALKSSISTGIWPTTSGAAGTALAAIPPRSALLLVGLMAGVPTKSAHFDSTSGPGSKNSAAYTSFATAGSPALAVLENISQSAGLAVLATRDIEARTGGAFYDNTKTDYAAKVAEDLTTYNAALSGNSAIKGMLAFTNPANPAAPRFKGDAAAMDKLAAFMKNTGKINVPTVSLHGTADPAVPAGNTQWLVDQYGAQWAAAKQAAITKAGNTGKWVAPKQMFVPLWNNPPTTYTQFFSDGTPDASPAPVTGTNHYNYTAAQLNALAQILVNAAANGHVQPDATFRALGRKAGGIVDTTYRAPLLPFYQK